MVAVYNKSYDYMPSALYICLRDCSVPHAHLGLADEFLEINEFTITS